MYCSETENTHSTYTNECARRLSVCISFFPFLIHSVDVWAHGSWIQMDGIEFVARIPAKVFRIVVRLRDEDFSHAQQHTININTANERHTLARTLRPSTVYYENVCMKFTKWRSSAIGPRTFERDAVNIFSSGKITIKIYGRTIL